ncbi:hypothetical protein BDW22DRAFT_306972 [Trametopsis cervina]|nr:hypothetical protein BDW22DRAFT_306972 [Trametopsis cervina]
MLPFGWKVVWFVLSVSGLLSSWIVLPIYQRLFLVPIWMLVLYGTANTVLQVIFDIGLAWKMDPLRMPHAFCIAQSSLTHTSWSALAGLCTIMSISTASVVLKHSQLNKAFVIASSIPSRIFLTLLFPATIFGLNLGLSLRFDAIQPTHTLGCDVTQYIWIRLFGYAGTSLILVIPSFFLSCFTATRLMRAASVHTPTEAPAPFRGMYNNSTLTSLPNRRRRRPLDGEMSVQLNIHTTSPASGGKPSPRLTPSSLRMSKALLPETGRARSGSKHSRYNSSTDHGAFQAPVPAGSRSASALSQFTTQSRISSIQVQDRSRHASYQGPPSPIIFNSPSRAESQYHAVLFPVTPTSPNNGGPDNEKDDSSLQIRPYDIDLNDLDDAVSGPLRWAKDSDRDSPSKVAYDYAVAEDEEPGAYAFPPHPRIRRSSGQPPWIDDLPESDPRLRRTVVFQLLLSLTQVLAAISTLIDIFSGRTTPTRLGTQHVALLLIAWMPALLVCMSVAHRFLCSSIYL